MQKYNIGFTLKNKTHLTLNITVRQQLNTGIQQVAYPTVSVCNASMRGVIHIRRLQRICYPIM
jgi:hypothetical protein